MSDAGEQSASARTAPGNVAYLATLPIWNRDEGRLRAFWRVLLGVVPMMVGLVALATVAGSESFSLSALAVQRVPPAFIAVVVAVLLARYVDRRPVAAYGLHLDREWATDLLGGVAVGTVVHLGAFAVYLASGWARVDEVAYTGGASGPFVVVLLVLAVGFVAVAVWEELIFRGVFVKNGAEGLGWLSPRSAVVVASLIAATVFGVLHFQQATSAVSLLFWVGLGAVLAFSFALTGELAFPIGLHFAYNFVGNNVLGITGVVSDQIPTLVRLDFTGPEAFVSVAGIVNGAFVVVAGLLTVAWIRWRHGLRVDTALATWRSG